MVNLHHQPYPERSFRYIPHPFISQKYVLFCFVFTFSLLDTSPILLFPKNMSYFVLYSLIVNPSVPQSSLTVYNHSQIRVCNILYVVAMRIEHKQLFVNYKLLNTYFNQRNVQYHLCINITIQLNNNFQQIITG